MTWFDRKMLWWHWEIIYQNDIRCTYCGVPVSFMGRIPGKAFGTIDHVHPKGLGGNDDVGNLTPACYQCNNSKGMLQVDQFICLLGDQREESDHCGNENAECGNELDCLAV